MKLLTKGFVDNSSNTIEKYSSNNSDKLIKIFYAGNINAGRWKTLIKLGESLDELSNSGKHTILDIYTRNEVDSKMKKELTNIKSINFKGSLESNEVLEVQKQYDVLLHVESFNLKERLITRLSFSTKIVDYLFDDKPILAIGSKNSASISYLEENGAALTLTSINDMKENLGKIFEQEGMAKTVSNGNKLLIKNHNFSKNMQMLINDLSRENQNENITD